MRRKSLFIFLFLTFTVANASPPPPPPPPMNTPPPKINQNYPEAKPVRIENQNPPSVRQSPPPPQADVGGEENLKIILPPEELKIIREKLKIRAMEMENKLKQLEASGIVLDINLKLMIEQAKMKLLMIKEAFARLKEIERLKNVSPVPVEGVVGNYAITTGGVISNGEKINGLTVKVQKGNVKIGSQNAVLYAKTITDYLTYISQLESDVQNILSNLGKQTGFKLLSGERFTERGNP